MFTLQMDVSSECDALSAVWHLMHHMCDVMLHNLLPFNVCLNTTRVSERDK